MKIEVELKDEDIERFKFHYFIRRRMQEVFRFRSSGMDDVIDQVAEAVGAEYPPIQVINEPIPGSVEAG